MASGVVKKDKEVQIAIILNCAGPQIINIYDQFIWDEKGAKRNRINYSKNWKAIVTPEQMKYWSPIDFGTSNTKKHSTTS